MNPRFKIGIILFGLFLPLLIIGVCFGVISSKKKKIAAEYETRKSAYQQQQLQMKSNKALEARLSRYDERKGDWDVLLKNSDIGAVTSLLKEISEEYRGTNTFHQGSFNFVNKETGIGAVSQQPSVSFNVSLSGTYLAIQQSLLSLESKMPNLSLNSMTLTSEANSPGSPLRAELSYSVWTQ